LKTAGNRRLFCLNKFFMEAPLQNKAASRPLMTLDPADYFPRQEEKAIVDLKDFLFQGLILREKDFRAQVESTDWSLYRDKYTGIICSADAIVPLWAWMVISSALSPFAKDIAVGSPDRLDDIFQMRRLEQLNPEDYRGQRVVVKGCGDRPIGEGAYAIIARKLAPVCRALMFGEPCSTVPVFRN
jgi:hypothetical protein